MEEEGEQKEKEETESLCGPQSLKYIPSGHLQKEFEDPWYRERNPEVWGWV